MKKADKAYARYLARHKWFVLRAGLKTGVPLWRLLIHDWSKFLPDEWIPYRENFFAYPRGMQPLAVKRAFEAAWLKHQNRQPHHWQFWLLVRDNGESEALEIPHHFVREMVSDWAGAGRAITGAWDVAAWYEKNKNVMVLHPQTRIKVEAIIGQLGIEAVPVVVE